MAFVKATRQQAKLRMALQGPSGGGKTRSSLEIARHFGRVALIDTESGSASKYAGVNGLDFDVDEVSGNYHPRQVGEKIRAAADAGYDIAIVDSLSHFWSGPGGFLELVDAEVKKMKARGNKPDSFAAWKDVDPIYKRMIQDILNAPIHVIVTLRAKQSYEKQDDGGKTKVVKIGMQPEIRDNFQYEMDVEGMLDMEQNLVIGKTRCDSIRGKLYHEPGKEFAEHLKRWLGEGAPATVPATAVASVAVVPAAGSGVIGQDSALSFFFEYSEKIQKAATPDELRAFLPTMKSLYPNMEPSQVEALRAAYTERSAALKGAAFVPGSSG